MTSYKISICDVSFAIHSLMVLYLLSTHRQLKELMNAKKNYIGCYKMTELKESQLLCKYQYMLWFIKWTWNLTWSFANKQDAENAADEIKTCNVLDLENALGENRNCCRVVSYINVQCNNT